MILILTAYFHKHSTTVCGSSPPRRIERITAAGQSIKRGLIELYLIQYFLLYCKKKKKKRKKTKKKTATTAKRKMPQAM